MSTEAEAKIEHTPGPWQQDGIAISAGYDKTICVMGEIDGFESGYTPCQNHKANARLIAAAPDLLNALRSISTKARALSDDSYTSNRGLWLACADEADAAISKAEGRS